MHIKKIINQHRRDFRAIYVCEHCSHEETGVGYDDTYFHEFVIPKMVCPECGKVVGWDYEPRATKYPDGVTV